MKQKIMIGICCGAICASCAEKQTATIRPRKIVKDRPAVRMSGNFTKGADEERVSAVMGMPDDTIMRANGAEVWSYKFSTITFRNGRVVSWYDPSHVLRVVGDGETKERLDTPVSSSHDGPIGAGISVNLISGGVAKDARHVNPDQYYVNPYTKRNGSVTQGHLKTRANSITNDNLRP